MGELQSGETSGGLDNSRGGVTFTCGKRNNVQWTSAAPTLVQHEQANEEQNNGRECRRNCDAAETNRAKSPAKTFDPLKRKAPKRKKRKEGKGRGGPNVDDCIA